MGVLERTYENTAKYAEACVKVAAQYKLPCYNLYTAMTKESDWSTFLSDGLHFSSAGHDWLGPVIVRAIADAYPHWSLTPDARTGQWGNPASLCRQLPGNTDAPFHDEIPHDNLPAAFAKYESMVGTMTATEKEATKKRRVE